MLCSLYVHFYGYVCLRKRLQSYVSVHSAASSMSPVAGMDDRKNVRGLDWNLCLFALL